MGSDSAIPAAALAVVAAGAVLAFAAAVIPHYDAGYRLAGAVLFTSLVPYAAYAALLRLLRRGAAVAGGLAVLAVDLAVKIPQRFVHFDGYDGALVYAVPLLLTVTVLPACVLLGRRRLPAGPAAGDGP